MKMNQEQAKSIVDKIDQDVPLTDNDLMVATMGALVIGDYMLPDDCMRRMAVIFGEDAVKDFESHLDSFMSRRR